LLISLTTSTNLMNATIGNYRVVGRRKKKVYTLGDKVKVRVKKTDIDKRLIDLVFADSKIEFKQKNQEKPNKFWDEDEY
jgi:exoribonuclease R